MIRSNQSTHRMFGSSSAAVSSVDRAASGLSAEAFTTR